MPLALAALSIAALTIAAGAPSAPPDDAPPCLRPGMVRPSTKVLVRDALDTLRRAGHDPAAYRLDLRTDGTTSAVELVFLPRGDPLRYALAVRSDDPCAVRWLWQPERFTAWQRAVLERARELLADSASAPGAELVAVDVFEAPEAVTVELHRASGEEPGSPAAESRLTLLKRDVPAPAGAVRRGS